MKLANKHILILWDQKIKQIISLAQKYATNYKSPLTMFKRFLDDIFAIFKGATKDLHQLFDKLNRLHKYIKFNMNHSSPPNETEVDSCQCAKQSFIPFLGVSCRIRNGNIETNLHRKEADRNMYCKNLLQIRIYGRAVY